MLDEDNDRVLALAKRWFTKLDDPANAAYKIAHARHDNSAAPFDSDEVLEAYRKTSDQRMGRLAEAMKDFGIPTGDEEAR